jgi:hypothetical protein
MINLTAPFPTQGPEIPLIQLTFRAHVTAMGSLI